MVAYKVKIDLNDVSGKYFIFRVLDQKEVEMDPKRIQNKICQVFLVFVLSYNSVDLYINGTNDVFGNNFVLKFLGQKFLGTFLIFSMKLQQHKGLNLMQLIFGCFRRWGIAGLSTSTVAGNGRAPPPFGRFLQAVGARMVNVRLRL